MTREWIKIVDVLAAHESEEERWLRVLPRFGRINLEEAVFAPQKERREEGRKFQLVGASLVHQNRPQPHASKI